MTNELDNWTLHCVHSCIKELQQECQQHFDDAFEEDLDIHCLIFKNQLLALVHLQQKIEELKIPSVREKFKVDYND